MNLKKAMTPSANKLPIKKKSKLSILQISIISILSLCIVSMFCGFIVLLGNDLSLSNTPTPKIPETQIPIEKIIILTSDAAHIQTQAYFTPTFQPQEPLQTNTFTPTVTLISINSMQTSTSEGELFFVAANTPFIFLTPTNNSPSGNTICSCSSDTYNCDDFRAQREAQTCFSYCISQGKGDIHKLDQDNNNIACESLP